MRHFMNYYLPLFLLTLLLGLNASLFAQEEIAGDTLQELEIVGFSEKKFASGAVFSKPDSVLLSLYASESLGRLLQQSTGVYMKSYGSSRLSTAGFRGTSAEHTRLLWNGLPINSPTLGLSDLAIFPTLAFNDIQIHHGAGGALFGSGAIGGTIQLANQAEGRQKPSVMLHQGFGSFSWRQTNLQVKYGKNAWEGRTLMYYSESNNDFEIRQPNQVSRRVQQNARIRLLGIIQDLYWTGKNTTFDSHLWYYSSDRMLPPPITRSADDDRQWDRGWRWASNLRWKNTLGRLAVQTGWMHDINHFKDYQTVDNTTTTDQWTIDTRQSFDLGTRMEGQVGVRTSLFHAIGENLNDVWEERLAAYGLWRWQWKRLKASAQLRKEWVVGFDSPLTPALGLSWELIDGWQLKGQISKGYRIPTLNHRYWQPGGNPDIKPEHSLSYEGGLSWERQGSKWRLEGQAQYFRMQVEDWIYWRPTNAGYWSPDNISEVLLQGVELMATGKSKHWQWGLQYTLTKGEQVSQKGNDNAESRLFYVPMHKGNVWANWQVSPLWEVTANYQYTGMRYDIDRTALAAFSTLDIALRLQLKGKEWEGVSWLFKIDNLLDADYQNVVNYPMPGRNWKLQLEVTME